MPELANAWVVVTAETSGITRGIRTALGQGQRDADAAGRTTGRSFASSFGASLKGLGAAAGVTGGVVAVGAAMKSAVAAGMDFESSLNTMQAVAGASAEQVAKVGQVARQLGTDNSLAATSSVDAAQAMLELAKGGFSVSDSMKAARGTLQLAAAAQISAGEAATIQSQALQAFGKDASYAGAAADILANSANASSAEIGDVALALAQSGTVANGFGISMQDTAAAIALFANNGIQGSDAGTLLKSALLGVTDTGKPAKAAMDQLGFSAYDQQGKFVGLSAVFGQLQAASKRMTPQAYQAATATLFGTDAARLSMVAMKDGAAGYDRMAAAMGKQGSAAEVAAAKMQGLPGAWERFKNSAQDAGLAFYDSVKGPLTQAAIFGSDAIEKITDKAGELGGKVKESLSDAFESFKSAGGVDALGNWGGRIGGALESVWASAQKLLPVVGNLTEVFAQAGAVVSAVGIESFVSILEATANILSSSVVPVLQLTNSAIDSMQPLVVAAIAAWLGFKAVGPALAALRGQVTSLSTTTTSRMNTARGAITGFGSAWRTSIGYMQQANPSLSTAGASMRVIGANAGMAARGGVSALAGAFGGPLGLAITGAVVAGAAWSSSVQRQKSLTDDYNASLRGLAEEQKNTNSLLSKTRGVADESVFSSLSKQIDQYRDSIDAASQKDAKWTDVTKSWFNGSDWAKNLWGNSDDDTVSRMDRAASEAKAAKAALDGLGLTSDDIGRRIGGSAQQWDTFRTTLEGLGAGGRTAANALQLQRDVLVKQQESARRVTPGVAELGEAMRVMSDKGASAADKLTALRAAMDALNPARTKTEAEAQYGESVRKAQQATAGTEDTPAAINASAFGKSGQLDATNDAGAALSRTLSDLADKSAQVAAAGGNMGAVNAENEKRFQALAVATNQPIEKVRELYSELGGKGVDISVSLAGAPEVTRQLTAIATQWATTPDKKTIAVRQDSVNDQTRVALQRMNISVRNIPNSTDVEIVANDAIAQSRILLLQNNLEVLDQMKVNPNLDLNTLQFKASSDAARADLNGLRTMVADPSANLVINDLLAGKTVAISELDKITQAKVTPEARLLINKLLSDAQLANTALDRIATERIARIKLETQGLDIGDRTASGMVWRGPGLATNAEGSIRSYAQGGIAAAERYANGGALRDATVLPGRGRGSLYQTPAGPAVGAEGETVAEAWIPFASSKRGRSTDILATVADVFGYSLLPKGSIPDDLSGQVGGVTGGAVSSLWNRVSSGMAKFADGGIRTAGDILQFARAGADGSGPLTGASYNFGGIKWGDCSAAMAAIARFAVGLAPFGGRMATANEGDYLARLGFKMGSGGSGSLRIGWIDNPGGPGGGHTAGTLPTGENVEMGGSYGGGMLGGNVGANDSQFVNRAYLDVPGGGGTGTDSLTGGSDASASGASSVSDSALASGYSFDPVTTGGTDSAGDTSLSGRAGSVVSAFVSGQLKDLFGILSVNDQPGWLSAITEYEKAHSADAKQNYDALKKKLDADFKSAEDQRKSDYDEAKSAIDSDYQAQLISASERDRRQMTLKAQFEADTIAKRHDYENDVVATAKGYGQADDSSVQSLSMKQRYENDQLRQTQQLSASQYERDAQFSRDKKALESLRDSKSISQDEYQRRLAATKSKYDNDMRGIKDRFSADQGALKERFDRSQDQFAPSDRYIPNTVTTSRFAPSDPGTSSTGRRGDPDSGGPTKKSIKEAFKDGLREAWRFGEAWTDTDWLVNKESTWQPDARNGKFYGLGQYSPEAWAAAGKTETADPTTQGQVHDHYVGGRYQTPQNARDFWQKNNYYDQGGEAHGIGVMQKNTIRPERVLSPNETAAFQDRMRNGGFGDGDGVDRLEAKFDRLIDVMTKRPPLVPVVVPDEAGRRRVERDRTVQRHLVGK